MRQARALLPIARRKTRAIERILPYSKALQETISHRTEFGNVSRGSIASRGIHSALMLNRIQRYDSANSDSWIEDRKEEARWHSPYRQRPRNAADFP